MSADEVTTTAPTRLEDVLPPDLLAELEAYRAHEPDESTVEGYIEARIRERLEVVDDVSVEAFLEGWTVKQAVAEVDRRIAARSGDTAAILAGVIGYAPPLQVADGPGEVYRSWPADLEVTAETLDRFAVVLDSRGTFIRHPDLALLGVVDDEARRQAIEEDERLEAAIRSGLEQAEGSATVQVDALLRGLVGLEEPGTRVEIAPKNLGRLTGWAIVCEEHGAADEARHSQEAAVEFAREHLREYHEAKGRIVVQTKAIGQAPRSKSKNRKRKGRRRG